jgi:phospholipid/cholesterol/gamma-HCH transport system ATP-binding protein
MILLQRPTAGRVRVFGEEVENLDGAQANRLRRRIGIMFQQGALFSSLTVAENVAVPLREQTDLPKGLIREIAGLKVALAGLPPDAANKYPKELSGNAHPVMVEYFQGPRGRAAGRGAWSRG